MPNNNINKELERAVYKGNLEEVKALLSAGADVNFREERGSDTLLHRTNSVEITKELLQSGAEVNAMNMYSETPLDTAIKFGKKLELIMELVKHGVCVNTKNRNGDTALNIAVKKRNLAVVKLLLEYGADINIRNRERRFHDRNRTPLDNAVDCLECAKLLIKFTLLKNFNKDYRKSIDLAPYKEWSNYSTLSSYLDDCVCEVLQMKTDEIKDGLPLYKFVTTNFNKHVPCSNQLTIRLSKIDYSDRYPIYNDIILDKIKPFLKRAELLKKLSEIQFYTNLDTVNQGVKKIILNHDSTYNIAEYLSNDDLLNFILAFDDSNKHAIQSLGSLKNLVEPGTSLYETSASNDAKRVKLE